MSKVVIDTNVLIDNPEVLTHYDEIIIPFVVLEELDKLKINKDTGHRARTAIRALLTNMDKLIITDFVAPESNDNTILTTALKTDSKLMTNDITMKLKCDYFGVELEDYKANDSEYKGFKEVTLSNAALANFYEHPTNKYDCLENEYLVIRSEEGNVVDKLKCINGGFEPINKVAINSKHVGKVKARNFQQELYLDLLQDKNTSVKVGMGNFGSGKDYLALAVFLEKVDRGEYDKIVWIRNNVEAEGTNEIGFLPGSLNDKLAPYADIVSDFVGGALGFELLLRAGKIELVHPGLIRGRSFNNCILYCTEAQNLTTKLVKLILSRVGEDSMIFFNGDIKQTDSHTFRESNGLQNIVNKLKGNPLFGQVFLDKCERSKTAELVSLL